MKQIDTQMTTKFHVDELEQRLEMSSWKLFIKSEMKFSEDGWSNSTSCGAEWTR